MIQAQFLCYILDKRDFSICELNNIGVEYFPEYKDEFNFIQSHYAKFHNTPDKETFIARFTDFKFFEVQESPKFLLDELSEEYVYNKTYKVFEAVNDEMMNGDSRKGVEILLSKIPELTAQLNMNSTDLLHDGADKRFQQYCDMGEDISKFYMPTGLPELDKLIGGWNRRNDFIAICGRPGTGKSLWMDYFLLKAAEQGFTVGLYSGEMDEAQVGYRLDTFMSHISNFKIAKGHSDIFDDYKAHIENMKKLKGKLITCTPNTLGGVATPAKLRAFCDKYKIDILGIDQYSLLDSSKNIKQRNEKFEDISKELKTMQLELGIPVLINAQLNRGATAEGVTSPGTEHLAGSDRLGQDCSIVLSITHKDDYVTLVSSKIRDANSKINLTYKWDIDKGILEYKADDENSNPPAEHKVRRKCEGEDVSF